MGFDDPVSAIAAASAAAERAGHSLAGFSRRSGEFGHRFAARCRRCGTDLVVVRGAAGWECPASVGSCEGPPPASR